MKYLINYNRHGKPEWIVSELIDEQPRNQVYVNELVIKGTCKTYNIKKSFYIMAQGVFIIEEIDAKKIGYIYTKD